MKIKLFNNNTMKYKEKIKLHLTEEKVKLDKAKADNVKYKANKEKTKDKK